MTATFSFKLPIDIAEYEVFSKSIELYNLITELKHVLDEMPTSDTVIEIQKTLSRLAIEKGVSELFF